MREHSKTEACQILIWPNAEGMRILGYLLRPGFITRASKCPLKGELFNFGGGREDIRLPQTSGRQKFVKSSFDQNFWTRTLGFESRISERKKRPPEREALFERRKRGSTSTHNIFYYNASIAAFIIFF